MIPKQTSQEANEVIGAALEKHDFTVDRGLDGYSALLGFRFQERLRALTPEMHWLDVGAGQALAQKQYVDSCLRAAQTTAITYKFDPALGSSEKIRMLVGRKFEEIDTDEIEPCDLVTDVVGVLNYTNRLSETLQKYFKLLKPDAPFFLFHPSVLTWIESPGSRPTILADWLKRQPGLNVQEQKTADSQYNRSSLLITLTQDECILPELTLSAAWQEHGLVRLFKEVR